ncbi:MAG: ketoacyl-ACP synthase III [Planctomycetaceae bacterium]|nr:ketoacyl-ACP synthase III [Planctomycetaceae bacterium]
MGCCVAEIRSIAYYLPERLLNNAELVGHFPHWTEEKIVRKLGIETRPIAHETETAADMAVLAAENLLDNGSCEHEEIDFVLLCTQSPDYFLPTSACIIHERLGLPKACGALDFNLGCSGYIYGLSLAKGLVETGAAKKVLFLTSETYSRYINPDDRSARPLFGDGAAATLVAATEPTEKTVQEEPIGPFVFGTDGSGADLLIVPAGGHRMLPTEETAVEQPDGKGSVRSLNQLKMHGPGIFSFAVDRVPPLVEDLLQKSGKTRSDIGCYVFHQANKYMLNRLQELCNLRDANFFNDIMHRGNTVSSSIPIAMVDAWQSGVLRPGEWAMLVGFGVGLSWGATLVKVPEGFVACVPEPVA